MRYATIGLLAPLLFVLPFTATGGPIPPCIKAASSQNGRFLVLADFQDGGVSGKLPQVSLSIMPKEELVYANNKVTLPATYWSGTTWGVILDAANPMSSNFNSSCPLPLISNDGEFLVLISTGAGYLSGPALRIYRRRDHPGDLMRPGKDLGILIRDVPLQELWPAGIDVPRSYDTDSDLQEWFAGGRFEFSTDCRQLIHQTRWGNTVDINLEDGQVVRK